MDTTMTQVQIITAMVLQTMMHRGMGHHVGGQRVTCLTEVKSIMDTTGTRFMRKIATRVVVVTLLVCKEGKKRRRVNRRRSEQCRVQDTKTVNIILEDCHRIILNH